MAATFVKEVETAGGTSKLIYGQGSSKKRRPCEEEVASVDLQTDRSEECLRLLAAFSAENRLTDFDWDQYYGGGFDVVDITVND
jgi:hypothetical protein